jgi:hypothetical protein
MFNEAFLNSVAKDGLVIQVQPGDGLIDDTPSLHSARRIKKEIIKTRLPPKFWRCVLKGDVTHISRNFISRFDVIKTGTQLSV